MRSNKGFAAAEALLAVVLIAAIGFSVWFALDKRNEDLATVGNSIEDVKDTSNESDDTDGNTPKTDDGEPNEDILANEEAVAENNTPSKFDLLNSTTCSSEGALFIDDDDEIFDVTIAGTDFKLLKQASKANGTYRVMLTNSSLCADNSIVYLKESGTGIGIARIETSDLNSDFFRMTWAGGDASVSEYINFNGESTFSLNDTVRDHMINKNIENAKYYTLPHDLEWSGQNTVTGSIKTFVDLRPRIIYDYEINLNTQEVTSLTVSE